MATQRLRGIAGSSHHGPPRTLTLLHRELGSHPNGSTGWGRNQLCWGLPRPDPSPFRQEDGTHEQGPPPAGLRPGDRASGNALSQEPLPPGACSGLHYRPRLPGNGPLRRALRPGPTAAGEVPGATLADPWAPRVHSGAPGSEQGSAFPSPLRPLLLLWGGTSSPPLGDRPPSTRLRACGRLSSPP